MNFLQLGAKFGCRHRISHFIEQSASFQRWWQVSNLVPRQLVAVRFRRVSSPIVVKSTVLLRLLRLFPLSKVIR